MQTISIPVCNIGLFGDESIQFWFGSYSKLIETLPNLENAHLFQLYLLLFIEDGKGEEVTIDSHKIKLEKCKVITIKPSCIAQLSYNKLIKGKVIVFSENFFSLRYNNNTLSQFGFLNRTIQPWLNLNIDHCKHWETLFKLLSKEYAAKLADCEKVLRSYLNIFLFELERQFTPLTSSSGNKSGNEKIIQFEKLVDQYFISKKLPSEYAELLNITPNHLNKICKKDRGVTAGEIIRKRIIIESQRMLHYTNMTVMEIADALGFENASYFITHFKKYNQVTPEKFRKS